MDRWHRYWTFTVAHLLEIVLAAIFALIFALILDLLDPDGRIRTGIRQVKNKWSERTARALQKRIKQLETGRDEVATYLTSDKALYLATFRIVISMLFSIAAGAAITALGDIFPVGPFGLFSILFYGLAVAIGIQGFKISALSTRAKVTEMVEKLDSEIEDLKKKLQAMMRLAGKPERHAS